MLPRAPSLLHRCVGLTRQLVAQVRRQAAAFRADRRGNVAIIFAIAIIPVFGAVGAAVDYSRANSARTAMQSALDVTALMVSKEALDLQSGQIQKKARAYFSSQFNHADVKQLATTFTLVNNGPGITPSWLRPPVSSTPPSRR